MATLVCAIMMIAPFCVMANPGYRRLGGDVVRFADFEMQRSPEERHAHCAAFGARIIDGHDPDWMAQLVEDVKQPALIKNLVDTWPALKTWSEEQFKSTVEKRFDSAMTAKPWNFSERTNPHCDNRVKCLQDGWLNGYTQEEKKLQYELFDSHSKNEYFELMNMPDEHHPDENDIRYFDTPNAILFDTMVDEQKALFDTPIPEAFGEAILDRHVAFGAYGTSHGFHRHNEAIQGQVVGYKSWYVLPREVYTRPVDVTLAQAPNGFHFEESLKRKNSMCGFEPTDEMVKQKLVTCVQGPGELMYVPNQFWHGTCNLDDFSAATGAGLSWKKAGVVPDGANVTFENREAVPLESYVVHLEDGFEQFLGVIQPGQSQHLPTHDGHLYRFKNPAANMVFDKRTLCDDGEEYSMDI